MLKVFNEMCIWKFIKKKKNLSFKNEKRILKTNEMENMNSITWQINMVFIIIHLVYVVINITLF